MSMHHSSKRSSDITGVIIAKNEELCIQRSLGTMSWCDELIVVDTGSSDRTCEFATDFGARVIHYTQPVFSFADTRNFVLRECGITSSWVMFLDADELCTPELEQAVTTAVRNFPDSVGVGKIAGKYIFLGKWMKHAMKYPAWHERLIRIGSGYFVGTHEGGYLEKYVLCDGFYAEYIAESYVHDAFVHGLDSWFEKHIHRAKHVAHEIVSSTQIKKQHMHSSDQAIRFRIMVHRKRLGYLAPLLQFLYIYVYRRGFLDGKQGFLLSMLFSVFEAMISVMVVEYRSQTNRKQLNVNE